MSTAAQAVELIRTKVTLTSPEIGEALGISAVDTWLQDKVNDGTLIYCTVQRPGQPECRQYRISTRHGGESPVAAQLGRTPRAPDPLAERLKQWKPTEGAKKPEAAQEPRKGTARRAVDSRKVEPAPAAAVRPAPASGLDVQQVAHRASVGEHLNGKHADDVEQPRTPAGTHIGEIRRDIPVPTRQGALRQAIKVMKVGDSRDITGFSRSNIHNSANRESVSIVMEPIANGFRIWRAA